MLTIALGIVLGVILLILGSFAFYVVFWVLVSPVIGVAALIRWFGRGSRPR